MTDTLQAQITDLTSRLTALHIERNKTQRELSAARDTLTSTPDAATISSAADAVTAASTRLATLSEALSDVQSQIAALEAQVAQIEHKRRLDAFIAELVAISHQSDAHRADFENEYAELADLLDQGIARLLDIREAEASSRRAFIAKVADFFPELTQRQAYAPGESSQLDASAHQLKTLLEQQGATLDVLRAIDSEEARRHALYQGLMPSAAYTLPKVPRSRELSELLEAAKTERQRNQPTRIIATEPTVVDW
jgi:chromosome segregation ATPase